MTFIGKLFVLVNLAFSLILATAAFATFSSGIDWSSNKGDKDKPPGKLVAVQAEIAEVTKQLQLAEQNWKDVRTELRAREDQRRGDRAFYVEQLRELYAAKGDVKVIGPDAPGMGGRPNMIAADPPLQTLTFYQEEVQKLRDEHTRVRKDLDAKVQEHTGLTTQLTGDPDKKTKGLRKELVEERDKSLGIVSEGGITEGLRINSIVEAQLILKRLDSINDSIAQLQKYMKQKHGVDAPAK